MREPSSGSPFAALTPQEQRHRWTVWQAQQMNTQPIQNRPDIKHTEVGTLLSELPPQEKQNTPVSQPSQPPLRAVIRHSQYDAVLKRMQKASGQTSNYTSTTMQPSSGKP